jgi:uncharacterized protein YjdB
MVLRSGESSQLKVTGNSTLEWNSSNKNAAIVSKSGKVTAVKKGTAIIKTTIGYATYQCKITVK